MGLQKNCSAYNLLASGVPFLEGLLIHLPVTATCDIGGSGLRGLEFWGLAFWGLEVLGVGGFGGSGF